MVKHTPGPWHTRPARDGSGDIGINGEGSNHLGPVLLAECFADIRRAQENAIEECAANARLIAAAPALLEVLQNLADAAEYDAPDPAFEWTPSQRRLWVCITAARDVIEKVVCDVRR